VRTLLLLTLMAAAAGAQTIEVESLFQPASLDGRWKRQTGDDPRWADPAFDDSAWLSVQVPDESYAVINGYSWYRFRVRLPENRPAEQLALMIGANFRRGGAYEVFWNGQRIGGAGQPDGGLSGLLLPAAHVFGVAGSAREAVVAIRLRQAHFTYATSGAGRTSWIGTRQAIGVLMEAWDGERLRRALPQMLMAASLIIPAAFFLLLPLWRRDAPEYFWFGLWLLDITAIRTLNVHPESLGFRSALAVDWSTVLAASMGTMAWVGFISRTFRSRVTPIAWLAATVGLLFFAAPTAATTAGGGGPGFSGGSIANIICLGIVYYELAWRTAPAQENVLAIHGAIMAYLVTSCVALGINMTWWSGTIVVQQNLARSAALLLFAFSMAVLMNQRSVRLLSERQRLSREMESAAEVQSLLLTSPAPAGDAWRIEPVYLPASEVGGDFYRIFPAGDGAILVVVGDVSGKGLRAAMTVSGLTCAMEVIRTRKPGAFLAELNRAASAHLQSGFVTCCAALIQPDGETVIANAGHPAPYCDGKELVLEGGLPLGIAAEGEYPETIARGERFTFISDGVVEAENAQRELFGFERTREISTQSAQEIAEAAKAWGQNDDITVVTVRRRVV
jgi:sigma-B regulation protein RsbU (phosphoserine phosphatase)